VLRAGVGGWSGSTGEHHNAALRNLANKLIGRL
jgi:hypothetical protein